jgi:hypothetical protein
MAGFDCFVVLAEMRTGSNFLEANLNTFPGITCHGEAFNPRFIGYPARSELLGITRDQRDDDPLSLLRAIRTQPGVLAGFRYFSDHDPRVLDAILDDPRCAKIVLTRNPVESYVSRKIAARTGQWKLTNVIKARTDRITFQPAEFDAQLRRHQEFQLTIQRALQRSGQTAFYLDYEDLFEVEVMNGIATFLAVPDRIAALDRQLKKQNPEPIERKVLNFTEMEAALSRFDWFSLGRTPNSGPRCGPSIQTWLAAAQSPLLCQPLTNGPEAALRDWLTRLDGGLAPLEGFTYPMLRRWQASHPGYRSFAVLRHPLARAHAAFRDAILADGPGALPAMRDLLCRRFGLVLPAADDDDPATYRAAFRTFLVFLKAHLAGQTNLRPDPSLSSQLAQLQGIAQYAPPDMILREHRLAEDLVLLLWQIGHEEAPELAPVTDPHAARLALIVDDDLQALAREAYPADFAAFGFGPWSPPAATLRGG